MTSCTAADNVHRIEKKRRLQEGEEEALDYRRHCRTCLYRRHLLNNNYSAPTNFMTKALDTF